MVKHKQDHSLRLGLRIIKGLSQKVVEKILSYRPKKGFNHITELKKLNIHRRDIELLASADALKILSGNRYDARWSIMNTEAELPLFEDTPPAINDFQYTPNDFDTLIEDYASTGLSLNKHPITLLAESGKLSRFTRMNELIYMPHKSFVCVAGVVTGKQSPGTASGVTFFTLEDDTGNINVIVWAGTARAQKKVYLTAKIIKVVGILEREGEVTHVIAGKLIDLTDKLSQLAISSRDFH